MSDWVTIRHPDIEGTAEVTPAAAAAYAEKGWVLVDDDAPPAPAVQPDEAPAPVEQPDQQPDQQPAEQAPEPPADPAPTDTPTADGRHAETPTPPIQPEV